MRYLVTGGAGFIGSHLCEALLAEGHAVRVVDDFSTGRRENLDFARPAAGLEVVRADVRDRAAVAAALHGVDGVFHQAAFVSVPGSVERPELSFSVNAGGTLSVFEAARAAGVRRIVYASSAAVYGEAGSLPLIEAAAARPASPYGLDKLYTEQLGALWARLYGLEPVALRYFNVFGPRQDPRSPYSGVISIFVDRLRRREPPTIHGDGEHTRDYVYVGDVVAANLAAMHGPWRGFRAYNVGTGRRTSLNELVATLQALTGVDVPVVHGPVRVGDVRDSEADIAAIARELGYRPRWTLREGLEALLRA